MSELPPAMEELLVDEARKRVRAELDPFIEKLKAEGVPVRVICRAMNGIVYEMVYAEYELWDGHRIWAKKFLHRMVKAFTRILEDIELFEIKLEHLVESKRAGGSTKIQ